MNRRFRPIYFHGWLVFDFQRQEPASQATPSYPAAHNLAAAFNSTTWKPF